MATTSGPTLVRDFCPPVLPPWSRPPDDTHTADDLRLWWLSVLEVDPSLPSWPALARMLNERDLDPWLSWCGVNVWCGMLGDE